MIGYYGPSMFLNSQPIHVHATKERQRPEVVLGDDRSEDGSILIRGGKHVNAEQAYPDAPRFIPMTTELRDCPGRCIDRDGVLWLDAAEDWVRDYLLRQRGLPLTLRDGVPPNNLSSWQSAGLITCAMAGAVVPKGILPAWNRVYSDVLARRSTSTQDFGAIVSSRGWFLGPERGGPETGVAGCRAVDAVMLSRGWSVPLDENTILLPWSGGPRTWHRQWPT